MQSSIQDIRMRLLLMLLRAFVIVLSLSFFFFMGVTGYFLTSSTTPVPLPFVNALEGYYLANESWDNVTKLFETTRTWDVLNPILLDEDQRIIVDRRPATGLQVGSRYEIQPKDMVIELNSNGRQVGYLVITTYTIAARFGLARAILLPIAIISFILAAFLVIVALLLIRRFVNPLAKVIFAARAVANGNLDTRIATEGPQDLRSLSESFNEMAASLERNDRERREMLADIAHELRTPLSVIRGRLEGIIDGIYRDSGPQVSLALEQTYILQRLVDDLRLLTLAENRQLPFDKQDVNVIEVIESVLAMFSAEAQEKNISLTFDKKNTDRLFAVLDRQRFEQVISNLVGNALRFVPDGGKVWIKVNEIENSLQITIHDNGPGVPPESLPYIFDRFWRKDKSRSRVSGGTGLGLAIAKQLIEAQGGKIEARNLPGGGLQVAIEIEK